MIRFNSAGHRSRGFSLLEVMIAVVILATGLLALAALQGSLTRSSAEAKVRGRVVAMLSARLDQLRSAGYGTLIDGGPTSTVSTTGDCDPATPDATDWIDCTRIQAGLGSLTSTQTVASWSGTASFTQTVPANTKVAQFRRVSLTASWSDATGGNHQLAMASDVSPLGLTNNLVPPPADTASGAGGPVVRTTNPATAGVIPIALGNGNSSAASNPTPELVGQQNNQKIVGTRFNVLTYTPAGNAAVIQKRFENEVIKCSCQYGAGGTNLPAIYQTAQWPAIWTGDRYDLYKTTPVTDAPGQLLAHPAGPKSGVEQSPLCQECCRDHHDDSTTGVAKFDPERSDGLTTKYYLNNANVLTAVSNTNSGTDYVNACRVIRVDGFWRTASDMYSRQFGLLETGTGSNPRATTGLPTNNATTAYTSFVKTYVRGYDGTVGTAPTGAQALYDGTANINDPLSPGVIINPPSNTDYRYLHGRGLYIDYLEDKARTKLVDVLADNGAQGRCPTALKASNPEDCILPYLPFTSANLTEIATWVASNTSVLGVNSANLLATNPSQPSGGRSFGKANGTSDNTATVRKSNSGVAVNTETAFANLNGVDPTDNSVVGTDVQPFQVGGASNPGVDFFVNITGGGPAPHVFFTITATGENAECIKNANGIRPCTVINSTLPQAGSIRLQDYSLDTTVATNTTTVLNGIQCTYNGSPVTIQTNGQNATIDVPAFRNYYVSAVGGITASGSPPYTVANDGKKSETTLVTFESIPAGATATVTLTQQAGSPILATLVSCTATLDKGKYYFGTGTWNKPWLP